MFCDNCLKLAAIFTNKKCIRCQGNVIKNISVICETCSNQAKQCSACLKKINNNAGKKYYYGGCASCRR